MDLPRVAPHPLLTDPRLGERFAHEVSQFPALVLWNGGHDERQSNIIVKPTPSYFVPQIRLVPGKRKAQHHPAQQQLSEVRCVPAGLPLATARGSST